MLEQLFGRLHILLLHLPIGILLLAALFEWIDHWKRIDIDKNVRTFTYGVGSLSAILACITGYILSENGNYSEGITDNHMWAGIVTTIISIAIYWMSYKQKHLSIRWLSLLVVVAIGVTGHLGGSITHGESFLTDFSKNGKMQKTGPVFNISDIPEAKLYPDLIQPILEAKCVGCHGPSKQKGKLRLDSEAFILKAGKSGKMLINTVDESEMLHRMMLPMNDDDHMPPKSKIQMSSEELSLASWWIDKGSDFNASLIELGASDSIYQLVEQIVSNSQQAEAESHTEIKPAFLPTTNLAMISPQIMEELSALDIVALTAGAESPYVELNFVNVSEVNDRHWELLNKIAPHVVRLKLSDQNVTNDNLEILSNMDNLLRLYLDNTKITNEGLRHLTTLSNLQYLNLNNTEIDNEGMNALNTLDQLKSIIVYQTNVTLDRLESGTPIIKGEYVVPILATDTVRIPES